MAVTFSFPTTVLFGAGTVRELPRRLAALGCSKPLLVTDRGLVETPAFRTVEAMSQGQWPVYAGVTPNPAEGDVELGAEMFRSLECDAVIALGGGSALDVGKVLRIRAQWPDVAFRKFDPPASPPPLAPCITIPTTAGTGSEVGRSSVVILDGRKAVIFHPALLARLVILDPELTVGLPPKLTAATGADALTHCVESYTSPEFHPMCEGIALEGLRLIADALPRAVRNGTDIDARGKMQVAAMMGGVAFQKDLGAAHSLAHPLSSLCGLHHGTANALCLPAVMEFNAARKPGVYPRVGESLGVRNSTDAQAIAAVKKLLADIGLAGGLRAHGVEPSKLNALADQAFEDGCHKTNPVPVTRDDLYRLYELAM
ncbi:MAG TPA: iron-containing alcohol dehydrogenase [Tepidisphaeraceae bacterium]|nr:iron-containing alcohol dehydrogenase [Tepidisphaeraceae bacterium]